LLKNDPVLFLVPFFPAGILIMRRENGVFKKSILPKEILKNYQKQAVENKCTSKKGCKTFYTLKRKILQILRFMSSLRACG
jgi:hypothetical protein